MTPKQIAAIKGMLAYFDSGNNIPVDKAVIKANCAEVAALRAALAEPAPVQSDGWLQDGSLLYRLTAEKRPQNRDEINVTMADGSRTAEARTRRAGELLDRIRQRPAPPADVPMLTDEELVEHYCAIADGTEWAISGLIHAVPFARAIEQAVRQKAGLP